MAIVTFKEFANNLSHLNIDVFSDLPTGYTCKHIKTNGTIETVAPSWYSYIHNGIGDNTVLRVAMKKYKSVLIDDDGYMDGLNTYNSDYFYGFIPSINETMYRLFDLFTEKINPYHNVDEKTEETTVTDKRHTENTFGEHETEIEKGEVTNENTYAIDTITSTDSKVPQNTSGFIETNKNVTSTNGKTDTQKLNKNGVTDTTTSKQHVDEFDSDETTDTFTRVRGGNIGVTTNKTLAFEHLDFADMMKFYDMFLDQYFKYFGIGIMG